MWSIGAFVARLIGTEAYDGLLQTPCIPPTEYLVIKRRERDFKGSVVRAIAVTDDLGGSRFASAVHSASVSLQEKYPFGSYDIQQVLANPGDVSETYKASKLAGIKW